MNYHTCPQCAWHQLRDGDDCPTCGPEKKPSGVVLRVIASVLGAVLGISLFQLVMGLLV